MAEEELHRCHVAGPMMDQRPRPRPLEAKFLGWAALISLSQDWRANKWVIVYSNGCFDLLHFGHVHMLQHARSLGDVLVVAVNSDASVRALKGPERPVIPARERVRLVAALECVDYVVTYDELTPERMLAQLQPHICCKGSDYAPPDGKLLPEAELIHSYGGRIEFVPLVPHTSTTEIVARVQKACARTHCGGGRRWRRLCRAAEYKANTHWRRWVGLLGRHRGE